MRLCIIRRWQWIIIGLVVGTGYGLLRCGQDLDLSGFERIIAARGEFESALLTEQQGIRRFHSLVVYPARLADGTAVQVVAGKYFDGTLETVGQERWARWRPACYIAEPSDIASYLNSLASRGVTYRYAWWRNRPWAAALGAAGGVAIVGVVWPTLLNLIAFGSLRRPPEERAISLRNTRSTQRPAERSAPPPDCAIDPRAIDLPAPASPPAPEPRPVPAILPATPDDPLPPPPETPPVAFGQDKDDYYPTQRHASRPPSSQLASSPLSHASPARACR